MSNKWDLTVDLVVLELSRRNSPFVRLNTEDLPAWSSAVTCPAVDILLKNSRTELHVADVTAIWNRRPGRIYTDVPNEQRPSRGTQTFVNDQWYAWLQGLQIQPNIHWVNHPVQNALMENKLRQLKLAAEVGFIVPETIVTNDVDLLNEWLKGIASEVIVKALYSPLIEEDEYDQFIFTTVLHSPLTEAFARRLRVAPAIFQRAVVPKVDYRVTVVGSRVFSVEIQYADASIDWRSIKDGVTFSVCTLPPDISRMCVDLVARSGLSFGAIDLVRGGDDFFFLEINPNGEWGWLERPNGVPIASAMCDLLMGIS